MSPQPAKAPEAEATEPTEPTEAVKGKAVKGEHNALVHGLLEDAEALSEELRGEGGLHERIGANRETLRMIAKTGFLSKDQAKAVKEFYPERKARETTQAEAPANPAPASGS